MSKISNELNHAIELYLGFGTATSPSCNKGKIVEIYGQKKGDELALDVTNIIDEANRINIDWSSVSLESAGKVVRAEMHDRHPELGSAALDAIAWKFTFDWR